MTQKCNRKSARQSCNRNAKEKQIEICKTGDMCVCIYLFLRNTLQKYQLKLWTILERAEYVPNADDTTPTPITNMHIDPWSAFIFPLKMLK